MCSVAWDFGPLSTKQGSETRTLNKSLFWIPRLIYTAILMFLPSLVNLSGYQYKYGVASDEEAVAAAESRSNKINSDTLYGL